MTKIQKCRGLILKFEIELYVTMNLIWDIYRRLNLKLTIHQTMVTKFVVQIKYITCTSNMIGIELDVFNTWFKAFQPFVFLAQLQYEEPFSEDHTNRFVRFAVIS